MRFLSAAASSLFSSRRVDLLGDWRVCACGFEVAVELLVLARVRSCSSAGEVPSLALPVWP